jgi:spore protease
MSNDSLANTEMNNRLRKINENQKKQVIHEILQPYLGDLVMAPKGIDRLIRDVAKVVAGGLNVSLHPDITEDNLSLYLQ